MSLAFLVLLSLIYTKVGVFLTVIYSVNGTLSYQYDVRCDKTLNSIAMFESLLLESQNWKELEMLCISMVDLTFCL